MLAIKKRISVPGLSSDKPPLLAKPKDPFPVHLMLPNGRVPAGSVALPGIHSVAAARAALTSNGVSQLHAGRGFNVRTSAHPASDAPAATQQLQVSGVDVVFHLHNFFHSSPIQ
jgi:hypothetical protein